MKKVLVTGAGGQLATCIKNSVQISDIPYQFVFKTSKDLDVTNKDLLAVDFEKNGYAYCINCAAYTNVDKAESDKNQAMSINADAATSLAEICSKHNTVLVHISTDFVFDGTKSTPYKEEDEVSPLGVYGKTKLLGEGNLMEKTNKYFIIRTSWLYSEYGHNFMKTMLRLAEDKSELAIVDDQTGTPTYAMDLAALVLTIIATDSKAYGIYHYSNEGVATWYDFAKTIFELSNINITVSPISSASFPQVATRPKYSVLDKTKVKKEFLFNICSWKDSLAVALKNYKEKSQ